MFDQLPQELQDWINALRRKLLDYDPQAPRDSLRVDQNGNVGLGQIAPQARLHILASGGDRPPLIIEQGLDAPNAPNGSIQNDGNCLEWTDASGAKRYVIAIPEACVKNLQGLADLLRPLIIDGMNITIQVNNVQTASRPIIDFLDSSDGAIGFVGADDVGGNRGTVQAVNKPVIVQSNAYAATLTLDLSTGTLQQCTITNDLAIVLTNGLATGQKYQVFLTQSGGAFDVTSWTSDVGTIKWAGGTAPTISDTADGNTAIVTLIFDGTNYYGDVGSDFS